MPWDTQVKHAGANSPTTGGFDDGGGSISLVPGLDPVIVYDGHNPDCKKDCGTCVRVYSPPPPALAEACPMPTSMPQDVNVEASAGQDVAPRIPLDVEAPSSKGEDVATDVSASYYLTTGALVAVGLIVVVAVVVVVLGAADDDSATSSSSSSASGNTSTPVAPVTNYYVSSAVTMAGISVSQFNGAAQTQFKSTIATKMSVPTSYMVITNYVATTPRRAPSQARLRVNFDVFDSSPIPQSKMIMLPKFLKASDSTGFKAMLNSNLASASIPCVVSAVSGVMVKIAPRASVPPLALVPSVAKDPSRRNLAPAGSSLSTFTATEETLLPGGIGETIKMPKEILCMLEQARVTDRAVWGLRTSAPASGDDAGVELARYDRGACTSTQRNVTNEWLMYQAWHRGNPDVVGTFHIHVYAWYYGGSWVGVSDQNPTRNASMPSATIEAVFTMKTSTEQGSVLLGTNVLIARMADVRIMYDLTMNLYEFLVPGMKLWTTVSGCGKSEGTLSEGKGDLLTDYYTSLKTFSTYDFKGHFELQQVGNAWPGCTGTGTSALCQIDVEAVQEDAAVTSTSAAEPNSHGGQMLRLGTFNMSKCIGLGSEECSSYEDAWKSQLVRQQAASMGFNENQLAVQTANSTSNLGVNHGNAIIPDFCLDRGSVKKYPTEYRLFDTSTGELWQPTDTASPNLVLYHQNTTATDANGKAWLPFPRPWWGENGSTIDHGAYLVCTGSGAVCFALPSSSQDLDGDGQKEGVIADNIMADGATFDNSNSIPPERYINTAWRGAMPETTILKHQDVLLVPKQVSPSNCTSLTLSALPTAPDTLHCGSAAAPTTATNGNRHFAIPTCPSTETYIDGIRQD